MGRAENRVLLALSQEEISDFCLATLHPKPSVSRPRQASHSRHAPCGDGRRALGAPQGCFGVLISVEPRPFARGRVSRESASALQIRLPPTPSGASYHRLPV